MIVLVGRHAIYAIYKFFITDCTIITFNTNFRQFLSCMS